MAQSYNANFGELILMETPQEISMWSGNVHIDAAGFSGEVPVYIHTHGNEISAASILFVEKIVADIDSCLINGLLFIKQTLQKDPEGHNITEDEVDWLDLPPEEFPVDLPELIFYEDSEEWMLRFAEGQFAICDPFGIAVLFQQTEPVALEDLSDGNETSDDNEIVE
ncbi:hypothetical protein [Deminuibacter soli]|uniref:DUF2262 domain-containing protein n=1 Tax=Deminuibacter soli TaxID=2291815 RepID=A0A3E1NG93_9BACT|nr:hypothetical protein [Deminuibacter soli]RFM26983.1 hypothetical protein DXN05_16000 [Deminuibacter soli]